jgi:hypothetical protein
LITNPDVQFQAKTLEKPIKDGDSRSEDKAMAEGCRVVESEYYMDNNSKKSVDQAR